MTHELIETTAAYVRDELAGDATGHDWWHIYRVWRLADRIAEAEGADRTVVALAALLHDIADWKLHGGDTSIGVDKADAWLANQGADETLRARVRDVIANVSFKGVRAADAQRDLTLELRVVQDADRLDAIGAIGVARTFAYGGAHDRILYDPGVPPVDHQTVDSYLNNKNPTINHFYEKLLLLKDRMHTQIGRELAEARHQYMERYLEQFYAEWEGLR